MKRDFDLIRKILLTMEAHEHGFLRDELRIDGYNDEQIAFHMYLLGEAGLVKASKTLTF